LRLPVVFGAGSGSGGVCRSRFGSSSSSAVFSKASICSEAESTSSVTRWL